MNDEQKVDVEERVVLSKFEGDPLPENEIERLTVVNGEVIEHDLIENGEVTGPVEQDNLTGKNVGRLVTNEKEVD